MKIKLLIAQSFLLLAIFFGMDEARAAITFPTKSEAYAACMVDEEHALQSLHPSYQDKFYKGGCSFYSYSGSIGFRCSIKPYPWVSENAKACHARGEHLVYQWQVDDTQCILEDEVFNWETGECQVSCSLKGDRVSQFYREAGTMICSQGCIYSYQPINSNSSDMVNTGEMCSYGGFREDCENEPGYYWNNRIDDGVCIPLEVICPEGQTEQDGQCVLEDVCPPGMIEVIAVTPTGVADGVLQCRPRENECPVGMLNVSGECEAAGDICPAGQELGNDGTCKWIAEDPPNGGDNPGSTGNNSNRFSGGDTCDVPPSCSGDAVLCGQARILWRIECNTRRVKNITGGTCDTPPLCLGEFCGAMEYSTLLMQWRSACALEKLGTVSVNKDDDTDWRSEEIAALKAVDTDTGLEDIDESSVWHEFENKDLNPNLFNPGSANQCATGFVLLGHEITMTPAWWQLASMIGWLMVSCAYLWVAFKLGS